MHAAHDVPAGRRRWVKRIEGGSATDHALKNTARVDCVSIQCSAVRDTGWEFRQPTVECLVVAGVDRSEGRVCWRSSFARSWGGARSRRDWGRGG
jgi:hypothetical protein